MPRRITIAGDIGSGKTTVARRIAGIMGVEPLSVGQVQRRMAGERGLTTLQFNLLAEEDPSIDKEIDSFFAGLSSGDVLVDARLGWFFVPDTLKVYLYISDFEAARRVAGATRTDEVYDEESAVSRIFQRRASEVSRFRRVYGVDIDDLRNYDLVIDTSLASIDEVVRRVSKRLTAHVAGPSCFVCPKNIVPTEDIRDLSQDRAELLEREIVAHGYSAVEPVSVLYVDHCFYVVDGHARVAASIRNELTFVPVTIAAANDEAYVNGTSARAYVRAAVSDARIREWEESLHFTFRDPIWKSPVRKGTFPARSG